MKVIHRLMIAAAAAPLLWAGLAYQVSRPQDASGYQRVALQVAGSAHDAAATGVLVGRQQLRRHVTAAFAATAYDDAMTAVAGAEQKMLPDLPLETWLRDHLIARIPGATDAT